MNAAIGSATSHKMDQRGSQYGKQNVRNPIRKWRISGMNTAAGNGYLQKMNLEWASVWQAKCKEYHQTVNAAAGFATSQKMDLEWASAWRATCKDFQKGNKGFLRSIVREQGGE